MVFCERHSTSWCCCCLGTSVSKTSISDISDKMFWFYSNYPITYTWICQLFTDVRQPLKQYKPCIPSAYRKYCNGLTLVGYQNISKFKKKISLTLFIPCNDTIVYVHCSRLFSAPQNVHIYRISRHVDIINFSAKYKFLHFFSLIFQAAAVYVCVFLSWCH